MGGPCVGPQSKGRWGLIPSFTLQPPSAHLACPPLRGHSSKPIPTQRLFITPHTSQGALLLGPHGFGSMTLPSCSLLDFVLDSEWGWGTMARYLFPS